MIFATDLAWRRPMAVRSFGMSAFARRDPWMFRKASPTIFIRTEKLVIPYLDVFIP